MTNKELQKELKNYPDDWEVKINNYNHHAPESVSEVASWIEDKGYENSKVFIWIGIVKKDYK